MSFLPFPRDLAKGAFGESLRALGLCRRVPFHKGERKEREREREREKGAEKETACRRPFRSKVFGSTSMQM